MAGRYVALLRGINVGRARRVAMADLRALLEELGYRDVRTLLNSGNAVFTASGVAPEEAAARIEGALFARVGFAARTMVLTAEELVVAVEQNPLLEIATDPSRLYVAVLAEPADLVRLEPLLAEDWSPEMLALGARVAYLWCPAGVIESRLVEAVGRAVGDAVTMRNSTTMAKLGALARTPR